MKRLGAVAGALGFLVAGFLVAAAIATPAFADGPAVSTLNGKVSLEGGESNAHPTGIGIGSVTAPLPFFDNRLGGQLDLGVGGSQGRLLWGTGGQVFTRDPGIGLIGLLASYNDRGVARAAKSTFNYAHVARIGVEAAYYWQQFTPSVQIGYSGTGFKSGGFARPDLSWYPIDNLMLMAGADFNSNKNYARLGVEYQPRMFGYNGLTLFGEGGISGQRASYALFGLRYYFGPDKTLIRRHREDDPPNLVGGDGVGPTLNQMPPSSGPAVSSSGIGT